MVWKKSEFGDLERRIRARGGEPNGKFADTLLRRIEAQTARAARPRVRLGAAVALTSVAAVAFAFSGGSGFAAYGVTQVAHVVHMNGAKRVTFNHRAAVARSLAAVNAAAGTPPGHQYKVVCGANSSAPCVASISSKASVQEPRSKSVAVKLTVSLNAPSDGTAKVAYSTADVLGATAGTDYVSASGILTLNAGQTSAPIFITILNDGDASSKTLHGETFKVHISAVTGVTIGTSDATVSITGS